MRQNVSRSWAKLGTPRPAIRSWELIRSLGTKPPSPVRGILCTLISCYLTLKYSFADPNTSDKAKEHAREILEAEGEEIPHSEPSPPASAQDQHTKRVLAGYKAAIHSTSQGLFPRCHPTRAVFSWISDPNALADVKTSDKAKEHAKKKLEEYNEPY